MLLLVSFQPEELPFAFLVRQVLWWWPPLAFVSLGISFSPSFPRDSFSRCCILGWQWFFSFFQNFEFSFHSLLAYRVSQRNPPITLLGAGIPLCMMDCFSLAAFRILAYLCLLIIMGLIVIFVMIISGSFELLVRECPHLSQGLGSFQLFFL